MITPSTTIFFWKLLEELKKQIFSRWYRFHRDKYHSILCYSSIFPAFCVFQKKNQLTLRINMKTVRSTLFFNWFSLIQDAFASRRTTRRLSQCFRIATFSLNMITSSFSFGKQEFFPFEHWFNNQKIGTYNLLIVDIRALIFDCWFWMNNLRFIFFWKRKN